MPTQDRRADRAMRLTRRTVARLGNDIRDARVAAGLSQRDLGRAAGMSHAQLGRIERAQRPDLFIGQLIRLATPLGMDLGVRLYPAGQPVRDQAHLELMARFVEHLSPALRIETEVPIPIAGDRRAWDMQVVGLEPGPGMPRGGQRRAGVEAETRLSDLQALLRRIALKARDSGVATVILLVSDTRTNRRILREYSGSVAETFPVAGRQALAALAEGRDPGGWAVVLL